MDASEITDAAGPAGRLLKALSNEKRLKTLWLLTTGEKTVTELERLVGLRQPTMSQQLAKLRAAKLVTARREAREVYYRVASDKARRLIALMEELYGDELEDRVPTAPHAASRHGPASP